MTLALALGMLVPGAAAHGNGQLDALRDEVHRERDDDRDTRPVSRRDAHDDTDDREGLFDGLGRLIVIAPFAVPAAVLNDDMVSPGYFPLYPYASDGGALVTAPAIGDEPRRLSLSLQGEYIHDGSNLHRVGARARVDSHIRLGVDATVHQWRESLRDGRDRLWTGDANVTYRFAQSAHTLFRAGAGVNWLHDRGSTNVGVNLTYQLEIYPARPWVIAGRVDAGTLRRAELFRGRATVGALLGPANLYVGYDYFTAGRFESHGPVVGLGLAF